MSGTYTVTLSVREETVLLVSSLLHAECANRGTRTGTRALTCFKQAVLVIRAVQRPARVRCAGRSAGDRDADGAPCSPRAHATGTPDDSRWPNLYVRDCGLADSLSRIRTSARVRHRAGAHREPAAVAWNPEGCRLPSPGRGPITVDIVYVVDVYAVAKAYLLARITCASPWPAGPKRKLEEAVDRLLGPPY